MQFAHQSRAAVFARRAQLASLMLLGAVSLAVAADKVAELSDDFLEYLGSMEGGEENWMDFAADDVMQKAADSAKPAVTSSNKTIVSVSSSSASASSNAASTTTGKADK